MPLTQCILANVEVSCSGRGEEYRKKEGSLLRSSLVHTLRTITGPAVAPGQGTGIILTYKTIIALTQATAGITVNVLWRNGGILQVGRVTVLVSRAGILYMKGLVCTVFYPIFNNSTFVARQW